MITLFSSSKCPECPPVIEELEKSGIEFRNVDITNSMVELKEFLKYRDIDPFFVSIKEAGMAGVPTIMDSDGKFYNPSKLESYDIFK